MSKTFLYIVIMLLAAIAGTIQWQADLDVEKYQQLHEGDKVVMEVLVGKLDEKDASYQAEIVALRIMIDAMESRNRNRNRSQSRNQNIPLPLPEIK